jgi:hypothetical protein
VTKSALTVLPIAMSPKKPIARKRPLFPLYDCMKNNITILKIIQTFSGEMAVFTFKRYEVTGYTINI